MLLPRATSLPLLPVIPQSCSSHLLSLLETGSALFVSFLFPSVGAGDHNAVGLNIIVQFSFPSKGPNFMSVLNTGTRTEVLDKTSLLSPPPFGDVDGTRTDSFDTILQCLPVLRVLLGGSPESASAQSLVSPYVAF